MSGILHFLSREGGAPSAEAHAADAPQAERGYGSRTGLAVESRKTNCVALAAELEPRVRAWQFPRSRSTTIVNVPFVFAAE